MHGLKRTVLITELSHTEPGQEKNFYIIQYKYLHEERMQSVGKMPRGAPLTPDTVHH